MQIILNLVLIIKIDQLREHHRLMIFSMTVATNTQHDGIDQSHETLVFLRPSDIPLTKRNRCEGKVTSAAGDCVKFQFERLETLFQFTQKSLIGISTGHVFVDA